MDSITDACESIRNQKTLEHKIVTLLGVPADVPLLDVGRGNERFSRIDSMVDAMRARVVEAVRHCFQPAQNLVARFEPFLHVFDVQPEDFANQQLAAFDSNMEKMPLDHPVAMKQKVHPAIRTVVEATTAFHRISDQLPGVSHDDEFLGMFKVRCAEFKAAIALRSQEIVDAVCTKVYRRAFEMHTRLTEQYMEILARIEPRAKSEQEMQALREFADQVSQLRWASTTLLIDVRAVFFIRKCPCHRFRDSSKAMRSSGDRLTTCLSKSTSSKGLSHTQISPWLGQLQNTRALFERGWQRHCTSLRLHALLVSVDCVVCA